MKKRLLVLPFLALVGGALAGCGDDPKKPDPEPEELDDSRLGPASWEDSDGKVHNRVTKIEDGKSYYLAYYRATDDEIRVVNGEPHKDGGKEYPFYMGTSLCDEGDEAAIKISFEDETKFTMQFDAPGKKWDGKYISIYEAYSGYNDVYSVYASPNIGDSNPDRKDEDSDECHYYFEMLDEYEGYQLGVPTIWWTDTRDTYAEEDDTPKFLGSGTDSDGNGYISVDCAGWENKASAENYNLAFFYEI